MANLPSESETVKRIYAAWRKRGKAEKRREYLGASIIGHECDRYLWLYFRGLFAEDHEGRLYRLFNRGQREEEVFVEELRMIGCEVYDRDPETQKQFEVTFFGGLFGGHLDAVALGIPEAPKTPHVVEMKTHSDASFKKLQKLGVQAAKPMHYAQMQVYMGGMGFERALYMAVNKDNDELYTERIEFNKDVFNGILARAKRIMLAAEAPSRCTEKREDYRCKMCDAREVCWRLNGRVFPSTTAIDCRSCCHATVDLEKGKWVCGRSGAARDVTIGSKCEEHLINPGIIDLTAEADENGEDIVYHYEGESISTRDYTSEELAAMSLDSIKGAETLRAIKELVPGAKVTALHEVEKKFEKLGEYWEGTVRELETLMATSHKDSKLYRSHDDIGYYEFDYSEKLQGPELIVKVVGNRAIAHAYIPF